MIDFRYHIVSLVAIFMALAVGIVLGSGPLKDDISGFLEDRTQQLADEKVSLQGEVSALRAEIESSEQFAELSQPVLVDGLLTSIVVPRLTLKVARTIEVGVSRRWLAAHPLTDYLLAKERSQWAALGHPWRAAST